ncbi:MAG: glycine oxidase ThiO [Actinomycetota bacterium]|nr:glycine oxidase ThiO [Actinomycetota bacterium]
MRVVRTSDVLVVGGGVIGLAVAWRAAQRGLSVTLVDPAPGSGATHAAAGMLAPVTELHYGETPLLALNIESARRYPAFAAELEQAAGTEVGYRTCGTVQVAWDGADLAALRDLHAFQLSLGLAAELVTGRELRRLEPGLAAGLPGGVVATGDHQVDNRLLHAGLGAAAAREGVAVVNSRVTDLVTTGDGVCGARLDTGEVIGAGDVVLAAGAWSMQVGGLPDGVRTAIRPVKGQTLRLRTTGEPLLRHVLRGSIRGSPVYLVPRNHGRIVVGASSEAVGFDLRPRAGAVYELLRDAQALLPAIGEAELEEVSTGLRPGTADNAPLIGRTALPRLLLAAGHYRNGLLLAPVTADGIAAMLAGDADPPELAPFSPLRGTEIASATA